MTANGSRPACAVDAAARPRSPRAAAGGRVGAQDAQVGRVEAEDAPRLGDRRVRVLLHVGRGLVAVVDALVRRRGERGERADARRRRRARPRSSSGIPIQSRSQSSVASSTADAPAPPGPAAGERVVAGCRSGRRGPRPGCSGCRRGRRSAGGRRAARAGGARRRARRSPAADRSGRPGTAAMLCWSKSGSTGAIGGCSSRCSQRSTSRSHTWWPRRRSSSGGRLSGSTDGDNRAMRAADDAFLLGALTVETVDDPVCADDGVVVEVRATGVCRSDWHAWMGHDPSIALPARAGPRALRRRRRGRLRGARLGGRRPRDRAVLLRLRRLRAVPARRDPDLRPRLPAGLHGVGLVRRVRRAAAGGPEPRRGARRR